MLFVNKKKLSAFNIYATFLSELTGKISNLHPETLLEIHNREYDSFLLEGLLDRVGIKVSWIDEKFDIKYNSRITIYHLDTTNFLQGVVKW